MANSEVTKKKKGGIREYFRGVRLEMKKVVWPTKKDVVSYTSVVIVTCIVFALIFFAVESGVRWGLLESLGIKLASGVGQ